MNEKREKWTKGPWTVDRCRGDYPSHWYRVYDNNGLPATVERGNANSDLMASATELYDALQMLLQAIPSKRDWLDPDIERYAHETLKKARGEQ